MAACNLGKVAVQLLLMPVIARLLGPSAYGLYSLAMPSVLFVLMLVDGGLGQSLAREDERHEEVWSSAFWALMALGLVMALGLFVWSFPLARLSNAPDLSKVMGPLSLTTLLLVLSVSPSARLTRRSRIHVYAIIDLGATLLAAGAAVIAAVRGAGVWSLVIQMLTLYGVRAVALNAAAFSLPRLVFDMGAVRAHTHVGGGIVAGKVVESTGRMLEIALVSHRFDQAGVGRYGFANQAAWSLVQAVLNPIWTALYVRGLQGSEGVPLRAAYDRALRLGLLLVLPATMIAAAATGVIVPLLLGPSWKGSTLLLALVLPTQALASWGQLGAALLYAEGRTRPQVALVLLNSALRCLAVALPLGGWTGLAVAVALGNVAFGLSGLVNTSRLMNWPLSATFRNLQGPIAAALCGAAIAWLMLQLLPATIPMLIVAGGASLSAVLAVLVIADRAALTADFGSVVAMLRRRQSVPAAALS